MAQKNNQEILTKSVPAGYSPTQEQLYTQTIPNKFRDMLQGLGPAPDAMQYRMMGPQFAQQQAQNIIQQLYDRDIPSAQGQLGSNVQSSYWGKNRGMLEERTAERLGGLYEQSALDWLNQATNQRGQDMNLMSMLGQMGQLRPNETFAYRPQPEEAGFWKRLGRSTADNAPGLLGGALGLASNLFSPAGITSNILEGAKYLAHNAPHLLPAFLERAGKKKGPKSELAERQKRGQQAMDYFLNRGGQ